jgi:hypothetical protein
MRAICTAGNIPPPWCSLSRSQAVRMLLLTQQGNPIMIMARHLKGGERPHTGIG